MPRKINIVLATCVLSAFACSDNSSSTPPPPPSPYPLTQNSPIPRYPTATAQSQVFPQGIWGGSAFNRRCGFYYDLSSNTAYSAEMACLNEDEQRYEVQQIKGRIETRHDGWWMIPEESSCGVLPSESKFDPQMDPVDTTNNTLILNAGYYSQSLKLQKVTELPWGETVRFSRWDPPVKEVGCFSYGNTKYFVALGGQ